MAEHNYVGQLGENLAREYLVKEGYKIIEQNYKTKYAEIDLVCEKTEDVSWWKKATSEKQTKLVFVEVRTKIGEQFGTPEDTLDKRKLWKVLQNAKFYSAFKGWQGPERIDAICIVLKPDFSVHRLTHHENIIS
jgi:putative endonuclease